MTPVLFIIARDWMVETRLDVAAATARVDTFVDLRRRSRGWPFSVGNRIRSSEGRILIKPSLLARNPYEPCVEFKVVNGSRTKIWLRLSFAGIVPIEAVLLVVSLFVTLVTGALAVGATLRGGEPGGNFAIALLPLAFLAVLVLLGWFARFRAERMGGRLVRDLTACMQ